MSNRRIGLLVTAGIFGVLAIILYFASIKELDSSSARVLGTSSVVNVQGTVFAAACAIMCVINVVGATVLGAVEENQQGSAPSSGSVARDVLRAIKEDKAEEQKAEEEKIQAAKKQEETRKKIEELKQKKATGELLEEEEFMEAISEETSMMVIWKMWNERGLADANPDADTFIRKYKEAERLYGKLTNIKQLKEELKTILLG